MGRAGLIYIPLNHLNKCLAKNTIYYELKPLFQHCSSPPLPINSAFIDKRKTQCSLYWNPVSYPIKQSDPPTRFYNSAPAFCLANPFPFFSRMTQRALCYINQASVYKHGWLPNILLPTKSKWYIVKNYIFLILLLVSYDFSYLWCFEFKFKHLFFVFWERKVFYKCVHNKNNFWEWFFNSSKKGTITKDILKKGSHNGILFVLFSSIM